MLIGPRVLLSMRRHKMLTGLGVLHLKHLPKVILIPNHLDLFFKIFIVAILVLSTILQVVFFY